MPFLQIYLIFFFCVQLLLHFPCDFHQTFIEWSLSSASPHILGLLQFSYFWQSYCLLFNITIFSVHNSYISHAIFNKLFWMIIFKYHTAYYQVFALWLFFDRVIALFLNFTPPTFLMQFSPNWHRMIIIKCCSTYSQAFAVHLFLVGLFPYVYFLIASVCKSSYNSPFSPTVHRMIIFKCNCPYYQAFVIWLC